MKRPVILYILGFLGCLMSCTGDREQSAAPTEPEPTPVFVSEVNPASHPNFGSDGHISGLDSVLVIAVAEWHYSGGYYPDTVLSEGWIGIFVHQWTDRIYSNFNYSIIQEVETGPGRITFSHSGIHIPTWLQPALGPAHTVTYLAAPTGEYVMAFQYLDQTDEYRLTVSDSTIELLPIDTSYTRPAHRLYWRARPNSLAFYCGTTIPTAYMCDDFADSLMSQLELEEFYYADTGETAYPRISQGHYYDAPARFFRYKSEDDWLTAGEILENYTLSQIAGQQGIGLSLHNWNGEQFMSWMLPGGR